VTDASSIAFVTAEEASMDAFLSVSAASPYQQQLLEFTCPLRKLAWPPGYAIQSLEQQRLASVSADETAPEVPSTLPDLLEADLGIRERAGRQGRFHLSKTTRPVRFGHDREQQQNDL
jgi:hypothetical protein